MSQSEDWRATMARRMNRFHAWRATRARPATAFVSSPEPKSIGSLATGRQLIAGNFLYAGSLVEAPDTLIWDIEPPSSGFSDALHGFGWLDDLVAVGDMNARSRAQDWIGTWIDLYGKGRGPGWTPDLTGRRLIRWINHAIFFLSGQDADVSRKFFKSLGQQVIFLSRRCHSASPGLPRFEALTGLIYASLALEGMEGHAKPALRALVRECDQVIDADGAIATRNPEELLEVLTLLTWASGALAEAGRVVDPHLLAAIDRIAPTLRALRHADGTLARFHGGGRGGEGHVDAALVASGNKARPSDGLHMGYLRLHAGRTTVIVDAAPPPSLDNSFNAHASTLAFELTSARRPLIVNSGAGSTFGKDWRRAGRATPSHSTLGIEGYSSSRLGPHRMVGGHLRELLVEVPDDVRIEYADETDTVGFVAGHNGYVATHGLTHIRRLDLSRDGRSLAGEDMLATLSTADEPAFDRMMDRNGLAGIPYKVRFHLHPDVDATLDLGGAAVSLALKSGEIWVFRHDGIGDLTIERSVYLEKGRLKPRATKQMVLSGTAMDYATRVRWSLSKAQETPTYTRDFGADLVTQI